MADTPRDIIILGFRQTLRRTKEGKEEPEYWVKYCNRGMPTSATEDRLRHLNPANIKLPEGADGGAKMAFFNHRWSQIKPAFDSWVSGEMLPEYGIPLAAWPALSADQVKVFQQAGVKSVEDVRDMSESVMQRVRLPNLRDLKKMAGMYLDGLGTQQAAEREAARDAEIAGLKEQLAAAMALIEEQAQKNAESEGGKRKKEAA